MTKTFHDELTVIDALQHSNWDRKILEELSEGGVTAIHVTLAVWEDARTVLDNIGEWHRLFEQHSDLVMHGKNGEDIAKAKRLGKVAVFFGFQNSSPLEDDLALVEVFHELGVRVIQLTYNNQSLIGSSCYEEVDAGISRYGKEVIKEMNRLGMLIDLSHCGDQTTLDAIEISKRPVAITHAHLKSFHNGIRNKTEQVLRKLSENNGMLGLSIYPFHIGGAEVTLKSYCESVKSAVEIMGIDQVGFGTDTSREWEDKDLDWIRSGRWTHNTDFGEGSKKNRGWPEWPEWYETPVDFPNLTKGLLDVGFTKTEVAKLMGGNWERFFIESFKPLNELK